MACQKETRQNETGSKDDISLYRKLIIHGCKSPMQRDRGYNPKYKNTKLLELASNECQAS